MGAVAIPSDTNQSVRDKLTGILHVHNEGEDVREQHALYEA